MLKIFTFLFLNFVLTTHALTTTNSGHGLSRSFQMKGISGGSSSLIKSILKASNKQTDHDEKQINTQIQAPKLVIAGAPAAGKGTQCEKIKETFGVVHLSTGDILRAAVKAGTPLGIKAKEFMDAGKLVPDELIIDVVCDRLKQDDCCKNGWLLDGFPRTKSQADALKKAGMIPDCFVLLDVPEEVLVERVTGRRTDPETGKIYHMSYSPPPTEEIANRLVQRSDDTAEKVSLRYQDFKNNINAIKSSYEYKMVWVDGTMTPSDVSDIILNSLSSMKSNEQEVLMTSSIRSSTTSLLASRLSSSKTFTSRAIPKPHYIRSRF